jgi:RHS repeat-associated protein
MIKTRKILFPSITVLFLLNVLSSLYAQSGVFDRIGIIPGHGVHGSIPEENIDLFTGNVTLKFRDIYLPGPNGLDVEIWRVYNSKILKDWQQGQPVPQASPWSWVGMGWTMHMGVVHQYDTNAPVIEFPDGRLETAYPDNYGTNRHITRDFLKYDKVTSPPKLYFKNGVIWTFGATATINRADGPEAVRLVTKIENAFGHHIDITYHTGKPTINTITDSTGRVVHFNVRLDPNVLISISVKDAVGDDRVYNYDVGQFPNGYYRLESFTPPMLPAATFEYDDGTSQHYEMRKMTTSYGGILEYSFADQDFYFNTTCLHSRVVNQKKITFGPGNQATWNYSYPSYDGSPTGTVTIQGPLYDTNITYTAYDASSPWKIGLIGSVELGDGSYSRVYDWAYQQISNTSWSILGINMGTAKGPLQSSVIDIPIGDAKSKVEYLYESPDPKKYGLPNKIKYYVNNSPTPKYYKESSYYFTLSNGFRQRYMMDYVATERHRPEGGPDLRYTYTYYFDEIGKWGALKQVKKMKEGSTFYQWDYNYECNNPNYVGIFIDPPGPAEGQTLGYGFGVVEKAELPDYTSLTRFINPNDSSITSEKRQDEGMLIYSYDNLGRVTHIERGGFYSDIDYNWRPEGENKVVITQGGNIIIKFWDGMGRNLGYEETGDDTTLYFRKNLDAEGRVVSESKGSDNPANLYLYAYNAAGKLTQIADPLGNSTQITYSGITKTARDPEQHNTTFEYNDLPGLPTRVTDSLNHSAIYTYDAVGRLINVVFNGARTHTYTYDGLDNVKTETHPETGTITYTYDSSNRLYKKTWGGAVTSFYYNPSNQLVTTTSGNGATNEEWIAYTYNSITGRIQSVVSTSGWSRDNITYNPFGKLTSERVTIPGLPTKTISYTYDANDNLTGWAISPNNDGPQITTNTLHMPETVSFKHGGNIDQLIEGASYGPNKMLKGMTFVRTGTQNTSYSATFNSAGMLSSETLARGGTTLYNPSYSYDGAGNILGITGTAPYSNLSAEFSYDPLNRLTSATYSSSSVGVYTYGYDYDAYGNMLIARENGSPVFSKLYNENNRIIDQGFSYDERGNLTSSLTSSGSKIYYWDKQNRLKFVQNTSGEILGKYLYDDRGLRLMAVPPLPEINLKHEDVDLPDGGDVFLSASPGQSVTDTLTIENLGDANLEVGEVTVDNTEDFSITRQPTSPITPSGNATFDVQFHPQTGGFKTAVLTIPNNDVNENPYHLNVYGNNEPEIDILEAPDGGSYFFGEIEIGNSWDQIFTIRNLGTRDLTLIGSPVVVITGPDALEFSVESQPGTPVHPSQSKTFVIRFTPMSEGQKTAYISIVNNDWNENPYDITLLGSGKQGPMMMAENLTFKVTSPETGEELQPGSSYVIKWTGAQDVPYVKIEYSIDNGSSYQTITNRTGNTGDYPWLVPPAVSQCCLIRVSNADKSLTVPSIYSCEFNLNIPTLKADIPKVDNFNLHISVPDVKTKSSWTADVKFDADDSTGIETVTLNSFRFGSRALKEILGSWHHVRIQLDMDDYTASAWINGEVLADRIPLQKSLIVSSNPGITMSCGSVLGVKIWIEDLRFKFQDKSLKLEGETEPNLQTLVSDKFDNYLPNTFPVWGGWFIGNAQVNGVEFQADQSPDPVKTEGAVLLASIDLEKFTSAPGSFRFLVNETGAGSAGKVFSLPSCVPFGVSEGNFTIGPKIVISRAEPENTNSSGVQPDTNVSQLSNQDEASPTVASNLTGHVARRSETAEVLSVSGGGRYYLYSFDGKLLAEYDVYGFCTKEYIYMGNRLVSEYDPNENHYYYHTADQINSTRLVMDESGAIVYAAAYSPYGGIQKTWGGNLFNPTLTFSGKEKDKESGLHYFGARYYDNAQYRFISADQDTNQGRKEGDSQLWHLYTYCRNNPLTFFDPNGRASFKIERQGPFYESYSGEKLNYNLGGWAWANQPLDIKITMNQNGKYCIDVKAVAGIFIAAKSDPIWKRIDTVLSAHFLVRTEIHEQMHLNQVEKYVLKKLTELEKTLTSDKVTEELHYKIWDWIDEAEAESYAAMDSVLGLEYWVEEILAIMLTVTTNGATIRQ